MIVSMHLVQESEEFIEPLFSRQTAVGLARIPQPPFANQAGPVASPLQQRSDRQIVASKRLRPGIVSAGVSTNPSVPVMQSRHQDTPGGSTDGRPGIKVRKSHALASHLVKTRSFDDLLPITTQFTVSQVVRQDENEIRPAGLLCRMGLIRSLEEQNPRNRSERHRSDAAS